MEDDRVIDISAHRPRPSAEPPTGLRREPGTTAVGHCRHPKSRIDEAERRVWCKVCGMELDIWAVIGATADAYERGWSAADWVAGLRAERAEIEAEVKKLRAERGRLRGELKSIGGRVRDAKAKAAPNVVRIGGPGG